ncbi:MAG: hypothetical protein ABR509_07650 [Candidatus Limnocylindria bacterium]
MTSLLGGSSIAALEVEHYGSLPELTRSADAIVRGRILQAAPGRVFGGSSDAPLHYAAATIRVEEPVAGTPPAVDVDALTLEIPLFDGPESLAPLQASLPSGEALFFLRNKGTSAERANLPRAWQLAEVRFYRLVVFGAAVFNESGVAAPLAGESHPLGDLEGLPFDEAVRRVRAVAP